MKGINGKTKIYGIIGNPVSHSMSPAIHNAAFRHCHENCAYVPLPVADVTKAIIAMKGFGICGASVTIPHKETIIPFLDEIDPVANKIGAVNTLQLLSQGETLIVRGSNTDWLGANRALSGATELSGKRVVILGAGGSARAIGFGLLEAGAQVVLCSRTEHRGRSLAQKLGCPWQPLREVASLKAEVLVNATSVGMAPDVSSSPIPAACLSDFQVVMDIVYSPLQTRLLAEAEDAGCATINGLEMLLFQAVAQFELWTGSPAPVEVMRDALFASITNN